MRTIREGHNSTAIAEKLVITVKAVENRITAGFQELAIPPRGRAGP